MATAALENAFDEASKLPDDEQNALAEWLLKELESETRWNRLFAKSTDTLSQLARRALREHAADETEELDPETF